MRRLEKMVADASALTHGVGKSIAQGWEKGKNQHTDQEEKQGYSDPTIESLIQDHLEVLTGYATNPEFGQTKYVQKLEGQLGEYQIAIQEMTSELSTMREAVVVRDSDTIAKVKALESDLSKYKKVNKSLKIGLIAVSSLLLISQTKTIFNLFSELTGYELTPVSHSENKEIKPHQAR